MILFHPAYLSDYLRYYKRYMKIPEFLRGLVSVPRKVRLRKSLPSIEGGIRRHRPPESPWPANQPFAMLFKPTRVLTIDSLAQEIRRDGLRVDDIFFVAPVWQALATLYEGGGKLTRWVIAVYRDDPVFESRKGIAVMAHSAWPVDLVELKEMYRRRRGFIFCDILGAEGRCFLGLNAIHIPDPEWMDEEITIIRQFRC